jgi:hypothetical protein
VMKGEVEIGGGGGVILIGREWRSDVIEAL